MYSTWRYRLAAVLMLFLGLAPAVLAQSQAANGVIEGVVTDPSGAVVPNATVKITNVDTGVEREVATNDAGFYRAPLLPLGNYRVTIMQPGFNKFVQSGITLSAGKTATVDVVLKVGAVESAVTVVADAPIADVSKIEVGRTVSEHEVKNLPLLSRNPYNFGLLQPGINGFENVEFGVPRFNANGYKSRINYQLDGNTNTQKDRAGLRLSPISEVFVREVQVVSNGFAPEFGQTAGVVYNAVTPSGGNDYHGNVAYFFRRKRFVARPFFLRPGVPKADPGLDNVIASVGGPFVEDKAHYYVGYEFVDRELQQDRVVTVTSANASALGLKPQPGFIPASQRTNFFIVKPDWKLNESHELFGRYTLFTNNSPNNIGGGLNTLDRSTDFKDNIQTANAQLISILNPRLLNEFRSQFSRRNQPDATNQFSGQGPSIVVSGVANFGAPTNGNNLFNERIWQILDNISWIHGNHSLKLGGDLQIVRDSRRVTLATTYTFPNSQGFLDARDGRNLRSYSTFTQVLGDPRIEFGSEFLFLFVQDDWRVKPNFKLTYGVRWELYNIPDARSNSPLAISQKFNRDTNNFAPRLGLAYSFGQARKTVLRASAGIFYDAPGLAFYQNALQNNGDPLFRTFSLRPTDTGAPAFPNAVSITGITPPRVSIDALDPNFANLYSFNQNLQVEQELTRDFSVVLGYTHVAGTRIPVVRRTNLPAVASTLADGRAVFGTGARPNANFNNIDVTESVGKSSYHAGWLSLNKRFSRGYQFSASYTWSHGIDDAPEINIIDSTEFSSDFTFRRRDRGNSLADQRHTFIFSGVFNPKFSLTNRAANALLNDNQFGVIARFNTGFRANVRGNTDLNRDGVSTNDRPLYIGRNIETTGNVKQVDLRYSRYIPVRESMRFEVIGEFTNLFNMVNVAGVNPVVTVNAAGSPNLTQNNILTASSKKVVATGGFPQRIFQLGFKFHF